MRCGIFRLEIERCPWVGAGMMAEFNKNNLHILEFKDTRNFECWLALNQAERDGIWLKIAKKTGIGSINSDRARESKKNTPNQCLSTSRTAWLSWGLFLLLQAKRMMAYIDGIRAVD